MTNTDMALERVGEASRALGRAESLWEIKQVLAVAEAAKLYAKRVKAGREVEQRAGELVVRAERKLGEAVIVIPKQHGARGMAGPGRGKRGVKTEPRLEAPPTMESLGIGKRESSRAQKLGRMSAGDFEAKLAAVKAAGDVSPTAMVKATGAHVSHNSGENEWYTPREYLDAARRVMGRIDCDPASSAKANETVGATKFFDKEADGLKRKWGERVWMNPPYAQPLVSQFAEALASKVESGEVKDACVLVNNATETEWFQTMLAVSSAVCLIRGRVKFLDPDGVARGAPLQGQAVLYVGKKSESFWEQFAQFGVVLWMA